MAAALALVCSAAPLAAQVLPRPVGSDSRVQVVDYDPDQVVQIQAAPGFQVTLQFGSDERIESVAVGDAAAWQVTANRRGDLLFVKPVRDSVATNLTVATDVRLYAFELVPASGGWSEMPYTLRFAYPAPPEETAADTPVPDGVEGRYRLSGSRAVRPSRISDDGERTYIEWSEEAALPAVYAERNGREALVDGHMRGGLYVIDDVLPRLVFRMDDRVARAVRRPRQEPD